MQRASMSLLTIFNLCAFVYMLASSLPQVNSNEIDHHNYDYLINDPAACGESQSQEIKVLILIFSAPNRFEARDSIRRSWGLVANRRDVKRFFLLALPDDGEIQEKIEEENIIYQDIIQENFADTYRNLTLKSVMMVKWATTFCPQAQFLLKIDDDCFLNPGNFFKVLDNIKDADKPLVFGLLYKNNGPHRNIKSKWYISEEEYPNKKYPDFISGPSYVHTRGAFPLLYKTALETPIIYLEDVFMNGLVRTKAGIPISSVKGFSVSDKINVCTVTKTVVTYHGLDAHWHFPMMWWVVHDNRFDYCKKHDKRIKKINRIIRKDTLKN